MDGDTHTDGPSLAHHVVAHVVEDTATQGLSNGFQLFLRMSTLSLCNRFLVSVATR